MRSSKAAPSASLWAEAMDAPPEPDALKNRLRRRMLEQPTSWHTWEEQSASLSDWLWEQWAPVLTAWGVDRSSLGDMVNGYRQELWLWVMDERTWAHAAEGLAGRIHRRAPKAEPPLTEPGPTSD